MTAEVAILNKSAVALAADSKVSIGGSRTEKTYDTQNKIFTLSKVHPVGILIYNNADFMGYPWETIIKLYRSKKKARGERTVKAWAEDFLRFLKAFGTIRKRDILENVQGVLASFFEQIEIQALFTAAKENVDIPSKRYGEILAALMTDKISELSDAGPLLSAARTKSVLSQFGNEILKAAVQVLPSGKNKLLSDLAVEAGARLLVADYFSPLSTGVAIAGFGSNETFPSMATFETDGYIGNQIKVEDIRVTTVTREMRSAVTAFAQHDVVFRFMEGIDPLYTEYLRGSIKTAFVESNLKVFERWAPAAKQTAKARAAVRRAAEKQANQLEKTATEYRREQFWQPTVQMVAVLPKDELAHLAESLVELTALHRKVSAELETVGGQIDVAIISKSDGFVWVKRKHYFKADLNPQFQQNYLREIG